ncbi:hypothetical protein SUGI_0713000 [Cryptomeria japonica]|nr:hypothetical protein SUGI_0713000 [Cryptomeria japonica]
MAEVMSGNNPQADKGDAKFNELLECFKKGGLTDLIQYPDYVSTLDFSAQNLRYRETGIRMPAFIFIPEDEGQLQKIVSLLLNYSLRIRVRCGGHSYEGLSYTADAPFALIDLQKLNKEFATRWAPVVISPPGGWTFYRERGGGGSWGVVCDWKIRLVRVPPILTAFKVFKHGTDCVTETVNRWQYVAPETEDDIFMQVKVDYNERKVIRALFEGAYLGPKTELLNKIAQSFPELQMAAADCEEMSSIESIAYFDYNIPVSELTNRYYYKKLYFKVKSDFAKTPLPESALRGLWSRMEGGFPSVYTVFAPLGGKIGRIPSSATPFP